MPKQKPPRLDVEYEYQLVSNISVNYWTYLRKPNFRVLPTQLFLLIISLFIGPVLAFTVQFFEQVNLDDKLYMYLYGTPIFVFGLLTVAGVVNFLFYLKYLIIRKEPKVVHSSHFIIIILFFLAAIYILTPKTYSSGSSCVGCKRTSCDCLGISFFDGGMPGKTKCIGVVYSCSTSTMQP